MLLNHDRLSVAAWDTQESTVRESLCPQCNRLLIAKRGELKIWHWAHKSQEQPCDYGAGETEWHLRWKAAFVQLGWFVERAYEVDHPDHLGKRFVFDAVKGHGRTATDVYEFVHSLSESYVSKSRAVAADGINLTWILDGSMFVSPHRLLLSDKISRRYRKFLKPKALALAEQLSGKVFVHFGNRLWFQMALNTWYPVNATQLATAEQLCSLFASCSEQKGR